MLLKRTVLTSVVAFMVISTDSRAAGPKPLVLVDDGAARAFQEIVNQMIGATLPIEAESRF